MLARAGDPVVFPGPSRAVRVCDHGDVAHHLRAVLPVLACMVLAPAGTQAAAPSTLKGKLTGVKLPAPGKGVASVRAMNVNTSAVLAAAYARRDGAFRLKVPAGAYGLLVAVVPFGGPQVIETVVGRLRLKAGKTRSTKLPVTREHRLSRRASASGVPDGFGDVAVDYPAIAIRPFDSEIPAEQYLGKGIADMLITDLGAAIKCKAVIVERARLDAVLDELERSKGPMFDPGTRPREGRIIKDNAKISGTLRHANGVYTATATYTDLTTGKATTFTESGADFFAIEERLARALAKHICGRSNGYSGTFSGTWVGQATGENWTYTGTAEFQFVRPAPAPPPGAPPGSYREFQMVTGSAAVSVTAVSPYDGCGFEGSGQVQLDPSRTAGSLSVQGVRDPPISYLVGVQSSGQSITVTKTGSDPSCAAGSQTEYPVPGVWISNGSAHTSTSTTLADQEDRATPESPFDYDTFSKWELVPQ